MNEIFCQLRKEEEKKLYLSKETELVVKDELLSFYIQLCNSYEMSVLSEAKTAHVFNHCNTKKKSTKEISQEISSLVLYDLKTEMLETRQESLLFMPQDWHFSPV